MTSEPRLLIVFFAASLLALQSAAAADRMLPIGPLAQALAQATVAPGPVAPAPALTIPAADAKPGPKQNLEPLEFGKSTGILGKKVVGPDGNDLGLVTDVIVDGEGHPRAAIIDFGGFLGVGSRKIAVDWRLLTFAPGQPEWEVLLVLTRAEIQTAPEYKPDAKRSEMVGPPWEAPPSTSGK
jgi:hypothetical protein